jgi:glucokinase
MYLAVDIGGSKTLLAVFSADGDLVTKHKIVTNPSYRRFLNDLKVVLDNELADYRFSFGCCGVPGIIDRRHGLGITFGNLSWHNAPIQKDIKSLLGHTPLLIENDACLAGLSEALLVHKKYKRVLYITLSRGIGGKIIIDGKIDPTFADAEIGFMVLNYHGRLTEWEEIASGDALFKTTGKKASEINDPAAWRKYSEALALGLRALLPLWQPEVVIIGGGVGAHFEKFKPYLMENLAKFHSHMVNVPPIINAKRPEEAVIYGCYEYIKQQS